MGTNGSKSSAIQPAIRKNPNYLARNNVEQTGLSHGLLFFRQSLAVAMHWGGKSTGHYSYLTASWLSIFFGFSAPNSFISGCSCERSISPLNTTTPAATSAWTPVYLLMIV